MAQQAVLRHQRLKMNLRPAGRADLEIGAPIWVRNRLEASAFTSFRRDKLSYVIVRPSCAG
jgi:hypothetical protein